MLERILVVGLTSLQIMSCSPNHPDQRSLEDGVSVDRSRSGQPSEGSGVIQSDARSTLSSPGSSDDPPAEGDTSRSTPNPGAPSHAGAIHTTAMSGTVTPIRPTVAPGPTTNVYGISSANHIQFGGKIYDVALDGNIAYVGVGPRVVLVDISRPEDPQPIGRSEQFGGIVRGIELDSSGRSLLVAAGAGLTQLTRFDPRTGSGLEQEFYAGLPYPVGALSIAGNRVAVSAGSGGFYLLSSFSSQRGLPAEGVHYPDSSNNLQRQQPDPNAGIWLVGNKLILISSREGLEVFEVIPSISQQPLLVEKNIPGSVAEIRVILSSVFQSQQLVDATDKVAGSLGLEGPIDASRISGDVAVVPVDRKDSRIQVMRKADSGDFEIESQLEFVGQGELRLVDDNLWVDSYLRVGPSLEIVLDSKEEASIPKVHQWSPAEKRLSYDQIEFSGRHTIYIDRSWIQIFNESIDQLVLGEGFHHLDPDQNSPISNTPAGFSVGEMVYDQNLLYLSESRWDWDVPEQSPFEFKIFDVSAPENPEELSHLTFWGAPLEILLDKELAWVIETEPVPWHPTIHLPPTPPSPVTAISWIVGLDISDPTSPEVVHRLELNISAEHAVIVDDVLHVASNREWRRFDVSGRGAPRLLSRHLLNGQFGGKLVPDRTRGLIWMNLGDAGIGGMPLDPISARAIPQSGIPYQVFPAP